MKDGLHGVNLDTCAYPDAAARLGRADHGATKRELLEAIHSAAVPGGGPTFSTGAQALMQLDQEGVFKAGR
jgi:alkylhydroperoxidase/carboxymuconolactone decarboxylase family protein YurZ